MTVEEIFKNLSSHEIEGMMFHDEMADYYDFLGLKGFKRCHEYHFIEETLTYRKVKRYFISHYGKLITEGKPTNPSVIPDTWRSHVRTDVDVNTKRTAVKSGFETWVKWERETKSLYEALANDLMNEGHVAASFVAGELIRDVDKELKKAECGYLTLKSTDFDMIYIIDIQDKLHDNYKEKMKCCEKKG